METENIAPVEIPPDSLSEDVLTAIIENFILREGTDYGAVEIAMDTKITQVRKQIERGEVKIVFDPNTETVTLITKLDFKKWLGS